jgi:hypothetical protein
MPKNEQETEADLPSTVEQTSLAGFLVPPSRPRSASPPPLDAETEAGAPLASAAPPDTPLASAAPPDTPLASAARPDTPLASAAPPDMSLEARSIAPPSKSEAPPSKFPASNSDGAARSLMPVETTAPASAADEDEFGLVPAPVFSARNFRRVGIAAAILGVVGVSAWFARRPPVASAAPDNTSLPKTTAAQPQLEPSRTIEADENADLPAAGENTPVAPPDPVKGLELRRQARQLLEAGQIDQGVAFARRAIEANPADPECYVLLAAGLQDQGRWQESREVFSKCVRRSNTTINTECAYFATTATTAKQQ